MTATDPSTTPTPWRTSWFAPRQTIAAVIAHDPRRHVLLLAILIGITASIGEAMADRLSWLTSSWQLLGLTMIGGALAGVISLYLTGFLIQWSSRLLGGMGSQAETRAAIAWSSLPTITILSLYLAALVLLVLSPDVIEADTLVMALVVIAFALGVWSVILQIAMLSRAHGFGIGRAVVSYAVIALLFWLVLPGAIRTLAIQPFNIPSYAMAPTLLIGDYMLVWKPSYGYSRYSLPFAPDLFRGRILAAEPERGDVVVYQLPREPSTSYISRVVGLPGDRIQMIKSVLHINGTPVERALVEEHDNADPEGRRPAKRWRETLPNGKTFETLDEGEGGHYDDTPVFTVPAGHFFMMGDNRDNAVDSRAQAEVGYVPFENLVGRAPLLHFSVDAEADRPDPRFARIGRIR